MAHEAPRINVCNHCEQYIYVNRFSKDPICPICHKESEQTTKEKLRRMYDLGIFYEFGFSFSKWTKIPKSYAEKHGLNGLH